jgi:hypothetical protein
MKPSRRQENPVKKIATIASFIAVATAATLTAQAAFAQGGLLERGKDLLNNSGNSSGTQGALGGVTGGSVGKIVGALPMDKIKALLEKQGYTKISNLIPTSSGDALQASAVNRSGSPVDLLVNPKNGQVLQTLLKK